MRKGKSQPAVVDEKLKENYNSEEDLALVSAVKSGNLSDDWVLDSGCSFHMSPRRDWFDTYESCNGGNVIVGNNAPCKVTGIGSIRLRTRDGRKLTLTRVQHVPTLGKNLISLGTLDDLGYNGVFSHGELSIYRGSELVLKGWSYGKILYVFEGVILSSSGDLRIGVSPRDDQDLAYVAWSYGGERDAAFV